LLVVAVAVQNYLQMLAEVGAALEDYLLDFLG
jgi:hypothetical protein